MVEKCKYCASEIKPQFEYSRILQILSIEKSNLMPKECMIWSPLVVFRFILIDQNISENIIFVSNFSLVCQSLDVKIHEKTSIGPSNISITTAFVH